MNNLHIQTADEKNFAEWKKLMPGFHPLLEKHSFGDKDELDNFVKDFLEHIKVTTINIINYIQALYLVFSLVKLIERSLKYNKLVI